MILQKARIYKVVILSLFFTTVISVSVYGAVPPEINYQGYLRDVDGNPINGPVKMTFSIYDVTSGGTALWTETHTDVDVTDGVYSVVLGSAGNPLDLR